MGASAGGCTEGALNPTALHPWALASTCRRLLLPVLGPQPEGSLPTYRANCQPKSSCLWKQPSAREWGWGWVRGMDNPALWPLRGDNLEVSSLLTPREARRD